MKKRKQTKRYAEYQQLNEVIQNFITQNNLNKGIREVQVLEAWRKIMGKGIERYTQRSQFKNGILYVQLSSSVMKNELNLGISKIIENLNQELGEQIIEKIILS